jgi:hypothetical protein
LFTAESEKQPLAVIGAIHGEALGDDEDPAPVGPVRA